MAMPDSRAHRVLFVGSLSVAIVAVVIIAGYLLWPEWRKYQAVERLVEEVRNEDHLIHLSSQDEADDVVYQRIREVLERGAGELAISPLTNLLKSGSELVRFNAVTALGEIASICPEVVPALVAALSDDEVAVRSTAAYNLGRMGPLAKAAVSRLNEILRTPPRYASELDAELLNGAPPEATPLESAGLETRGIIAIFGRFDPVDEERDFLKTVADALWSIDPQAAKPYLRWRSDPSDSSAETR